MKKFIIRICLFTFGFLLLPLSIFSQYEIVLSTNFDGEIISGSKESLIK